MPGFEECQDRPVPDALFLERLEAFMQKNLLEIRAFSMREDRPFEEIRRYVAEWHSRHLFKPDTVTAVNSNDKQGQVRSVLLQTSSTLESLHEVSGVHSFFLSVDPADQEEQGFLGGTVVGREFWRGLRSGGDLGFKSFKIHCLYREQVTSTAGGSTSTATPCAAALLKQSPARSRKTEVYANIRNVLRAVSGVRNAEMKWTNHDRLCMYGVRIVGWPGNVPYRNPSTLSDSQNKLILESLKSGTLRFVRVSEERTTQDDPANTIEVAESSFGGSEDIVAPDISWACMDDGVP